jgi:hypothetical protein
VLLSVKCKAETVVRVEVGKAVVAEAASSAGVLVGVAVVSLQFIVPAGEKWSVETASGIESVKSSYLPL